MAFACFPRLPAEIRERIWLFSLPDDTPEVCLAWPVLLQSYNTPSGPRAPVPHGPLVVDTDFPVMMHTCREARQLTLSAARSGIRFRASQLAGCPVPFRLFQPELDILYIGCDAHYLFSTVPHCFNNRLESATYIWPEGDAAVVAVMQKAQHLAVPLLTVTDESENFMAYIQDFATATTTVSLVVPSSTFRDLREYSLECELLFKQPARRCRLRPLSPSEMDTNCVMPTPGSQFSLSAIELEGPQTLNNVMRVIRESQIIYYKQLDDAGIQTLIQTFEERQPDGTYAEVCQDRRYINNLVFGSYPAHDSLSWDENVFGANLRAAPFLHPLERPDPQLVRVNDIDGDFDVSAERSYWIDADGKLQMSAVIR